MITEFQLFFQVHVTYGIPKANPIEEETEQKPINPYGMSKLIIENVLKELGESDGLESVILRYFNAAGASPDGELGEIHSPETHLIPLAIEAALNQEMPLKIFGNDYKTFDGTCIRDYVHVCDLADAHVLALSDLKNKNFEVSKNFLKKRKFCNDFNLGNGNGISVLQIINSVEKITGFKVPYEIVDRRPGDPETLISSSKKAKLKLGWEPKYQSIDQIVKHAYKWHLKMQNIRK